MWSPNFSPMLFLIIFFILSTCLVLIISRWGFSRNFVNFDSLAQLLHSESRCSLMYNKIVQGQYKGRKITCRTAWYRNSGTIAPSLQGNFPTLSELCCVELFIEPNIKRQRKDTSRWRGLIAASAIQKITDYTHLYDDGCIYFTHMSLRNNQVNFWTGMPEPNALNDKKSLWVLLRLKLSQEEITFFLEELTRAAEILETQNP